MYAVNIYIYLIMYVYIYIYIYIYIYTYNVSCLHIIVQFLKLYYIRWETSVQISKVALSEKTAATLSQPLLRSLAYCTLQVHDI